MTSISFNLGWFLLFLENIRYFLEKEQIGKEKNMSIMKPFSQKIML